MAIKTLDDPCPKCDRPMWLHIPFNECKGRPQAEMDLVNASAKFHAEQPRWRPSAAQEQAAEPVLQFTCPDHGIFEASGYDNPVFYADKVANCPQCGEKCWQSTDKPDSDISLSPETDRTMRLLFIDFGERCVIKIENSVYPDVQQLLKGFNVKWPRRTIDPFVIEHSFDDVRKQIDASTEPPVQKYPCIFPDTKSGNYLVGMQPDKRITPHIDKIHPSTLDALNQLARQAGATRDLDVYDPYSPSSSWTQLLGSQLLSGFDSPCQIWRYVKTSG